MRQTPREDDVTIEPPLARRDLRKRHANLKRDARLFRKDDDGAALANRTPYRPVELAHDRAGPLKMVREVVTSTRVRLIAVGEAPPAARTRPHRALGSRQGVLRHFLLEARFALARRIAWVA